MDRQGKDDCDPGINERFPTSGVLGSLEVGFGSGPDALEQFRARLEPALAAVPLPAKSVRSKHKDAAVRVDRRRRRSHGAPARAHADDVLEAPDRPRHRLVVDARA
eukprot:CAMPEP_0170149696 /NCGR_PEP_ID=MMETSP0033_2-20121228/43852_1 /TAXON_ID=195969 /ORGANISM="Dolichomastix tenuilepis, Strain CCMP3274" /LENGTH=105 /DNA_ID=CAMNT_0010386671 /DNA_START=38 /DNA_END=352 /DNA_ORIENTATION=-